MDIETLREECIKQYQNLIQISGTTFVRANTYFNQFKNTVNQSDNKEYLLNLLNAVNKVAAKIGPDSLSEVVEAPKEEFTSYKQDADYKWGYDMIESRAHNDGWSDIKLARVLSEYEKMWMERLPYDYIMNKMDEVVEMVTAEQSSSSMGHK